MEPTPWTFHHGPYIIEGTWYSLDHGSYFMELTS